MPVEGWIFAAFWVALILVYAFYDFGLARFLRRTYVVYVPVIELTPWEKASGWHQAVAEAKNKKAAGEPTPLPPNSHPGDAQ